jgi:hypothetical protein
MENIYEFAGLPITPRIIEELIIKLFTGKTKKRHEIVDGVLKFHLQNGGLNPESQDFSRSVKKTLANLKEKSIALNKSHGYWYINKEETEHKFISTEEQVESSIIPIKELPTHKIYGIGSGSIYLYYFSSYRELRKLQSSETWPCKIGRTDRDPLLRVLSQASTALPEKPIIEFIIKTEEPSLLETALHSVLNLRNRHIKDSPGSEWFMTNPEEVLEILKFIDKRLLEC